MVCVQGVPEHGDRVDGQAEGDGAFDSVLDAVAGRAGALKALARPPLYCCGYATAGLIRRSGAAG